MTRPTPLPEEIDSLVEWINDIRLKPLVSKLKAHARRDRDGGSAEPDGFPARAPGSTVGGGGSQSDVHLTAVEAGADSAFPIETQAPDLRYVETFGAQGDRGRYRKRNTRDPLHTHVLGAFEALQIIQRGYDRLGVEIEKADALMAQADAGEPGCESCRRIKNSRGEPRWEPVYEKLYPLDPEKPPVPTTVGKRLPQPMLLDRWCYDWVGTHDRLPSLEELRSHHAGKVIREKAS